MAILSGTHTTELGRRGRLFAPILLEGVPNTRIQAPADLARVREWGARLDLGEAEAIALALDVNAEAILIDESRGRAVARQLGLTPIGVLGVLVRAKEQGHVDAVRPLIERLQAEIAFFVSPACVTRSCAWQARVHDRPHARLQRQPRTDAAVRRSGGRTAR